MSEIFIFCMKHKKTIIEERKNAETYFETRLNFMTVKVKQ